MATIEYTIAFLSALFMYITAVTFSTRALAQMTTLEHLAALARTHSLSQPPLGLVLARELNSIVVLANRASRHECRTRTTYFAASGCALVTACVEKLLASLAAHEVASARRVASHLDFVTAKLELLDHSNATLVAIVFVAALVTTLFGAQMTTG
jgi:hypothetical protein